MSWATRLNAALDLHSEGQDWGIENADANRVMEFIAFYEQHAPVQPWDLEALAELILQSTQEALEAHILSNEQQAAVSTFFAKNRAAFPHTAQYWLSLNPSEWASAHLIRQAVALPSRK